jgi:hypothetical protein
MAVHRRRQTPVRSSPWVAVLVLAMPWTLACGTGRSTRPSGGAGEPALEAAAPDSCQGQFQKKLLDITTDLQKMGDKDYRVEMSEAGGASGVTIYARTMPQAVRQYLLASHIDNVPEIRLAGHRGYYQIRPRPNTGCGLDYQVRFVAP